MSTIICGNNNYDNYLVGAEQYLSETENSKGVTQAAVVQSSALLEEVTPAGSQAQAAGASTPTLPSPTTSYSASELTSFAVPSLGATILALVSETANESRQANKEARIAQTQTLVQQIENQADELRSQATSKLVMGLVSAGIQVGGGIFSTVSSSLLLKQNLAQHLSQEVMAAKNSVIQGIATGITGVKSAMDAVNESVSTSYDVKIKEMDAKNEQVRANITALDSVIEGLKELISKSISTASDIQANTNNTRVKILT